jgi:plastocyanin
MNRAHRRITALTAMLAVLILSAGLMTGVGLRASAHDEASHPAHIHTGTCESPGDVVFPLSNVGADYEMDGTPMAGTEAMGASSAIAVDASVTTVQASLADIVSGGHTIVAHESAENIQNYIACGDIGGMMLGTSDLPVGLGPLNDSGYSGVALLHDNGDGTTTVSLYLTKSGEAGDMDHDMGSPVAGSGTEGEVAASIVDFAYDPGTIEIEAGTTVTWTNNDTVPHTVSQVGGGFESGKMDPGATFSFTFDSPGTYEYFCQFHPNMKATVIVT